MPKVVATIEVEGEAGDVFDFIADYRNIPSLQPQFTSATLVGDKERRQGAQVELRGHFHGVPMTVRSRIVTYARPGRLASISEGAVTSRNIWELRSIEGRDKPATEVIFSVEYKIGGPLGGVITGLASSLFHREIEQMTGDSLKRLQERFATGNEE